jgi:hypothetical protein
VHLIALVKESNSWCGTLVTFVVGEEILSKSFYLKEILPLIDSAKELIVRLLRKLIAAEINW